MSPEKSQILSCGTVVTNERYQNILIMSLYMKGEVTPEHAMKVYTGNGGIAPLIINLSNRLI